MLELEKYGKTVIKEEFIVNTKTNEVVSGLYIGTDNMYFDGIVGLDINYCFRNTYKVIITKMNTNEELEDKILYTGSIKTLRHLLSSEYALNDDGYDAPTLHTWKNSSVKDDEFYTIIFNGIEIICPKEHNLLGDKFFLLEYSSDEVFGKQAVDGTIIEYYCHDYGLCTYDLSDSKIYYFINNSKLENNIDRIEISDIIKNPNISLSLPNISYMPKTISYYDHNKLVKSITLEYDDYGLVKGGENSLYEFYTLEYFDKPVFATSLHPFYFDTFDTGLVGYNDNKFCIDQVNRYLDEDLIEYTRDVYEIDPDKKEELLAEIKNIKELHEHAIPTI